MIELLDFFNQARSYVLGAWETLFNPQTVVYVYAGMILLGLGVIMWFLSWLKPVRVGVGITFIAVIAYVFGSRQMYLKMRDKLEEERARKAPRSGEDQSSGWKWPFP